LLQVTRYDMCLLKFTRFSGHLESLECLY
jgi:hypothetical protein